MAAAIDILNLFPELTAIGREKLQVYCDEWLRRPIAREFGIAQLFVDEQLMLAVYIDVNRAEFIDDNAFIPIDELLGYIIDQHFAGSDERSRLHADVREDRKRWGLLHREYEATIGRAGSLSLVCKNPDCGATLNTSHRGIEGQTVTCPPLPATCPICGQTHTYDGSDFKLKLDGV